MAARRHCGTMQVHQELVETYEPFRKTLLEIDDFTRDSLETGVAQRTARRLVRIPVVVHVLYKRQRENVSDAQIQSQIEVLNRDFRARNTDRNKVPKPWKGLVGNANIRFALAKKDPSGKTTPGITRTKTTRDFFPANGDPVKKSSKGGVDAWPRERYLNIWVCQLGEELLGYAQFPGGPAKTDGVVVTHTAFGTKGSARPPFNRGRTTTHEIGHWLNLRHIWGDTFDCSGSDRISDTPTQKWPNHGKPKFPKLSCNNGPNGDMFMNYMDYVDDAAMVMFTEGQVARMNACLAGPRKTFLR